MVSGYFIKMAFLSRKLFLILFFEHLEVEVQESLYFGCVVSLKAVDIGE